VRSSLQLIRSHVPYGQVDAALAGLGAQLAGKNWVETCNALHLSRQLVVKHKEVLAHTSEPSCPDPVAPMARN
jgi:hypothetical protein